MVTLKVYLGNPSPQIQTDEQRFQNNKHNNFIYVVFYKILYVKLIDQIIINEKKE